MNPDRPQHDRPAACVIAQQYSPATLVSLRFYFHKEEFDAQVFFFNFLKISEVWDYVSWGVSAFRRSFIPM